MKDLLAIQALRLWLDQLRNGHSLPRLIMAEGRGLRLRAPIYQALQSSNANPATPTRVRVISPIVGERGHRPRKPSKGMGAPAAIADPAIMARMITSLGSGAVVAGGAHIRRRPG